MEQATDVEMGGDAAPDQADPEATQTDLPLTTVNAEEQTQVVPANDTPSTADA